MWGVKVQDVKQALKLAAREAGFDDAGVCEARFDPWMGNLQQWLEMGCQGTMGYMQRQKEQRLDPCKVLEGARSVLMVLKGYGRSEANTPVPKGHGVVARYARGRDYHDVVQQGLEPLCKVLRDAGYQAKPFVDSLPLMEKALAWRSGLGTLGRNQLLIHPKLGSYVVLGGILTDAVLPPDSPGPTPYSVCGDCRRCVRNCPSQALLETHLDATQCLSYWTVEQKTEKLPSGIAEVQGSWVFGCDVCQEVCPHNAIPSMPDVSQWGPFQGDGGLPFGQWLEMGQEEFESRFGQSSLRRGGLKRLQRNAEAAAQAAQAKSVAARPATGKGRGGE